MVVMIFRTLWRPGPDPVTGPARGWGRWPQVCSDSSKNRAPVAAGVLSSSGCR